MKINVNAVVLWAIMSLGGYLFWPGEVRGALIGLFAGLIISFIAGLFDK
jgi:hypothetical protein